MSVDAGFEYTGPPELRARIATALHRVVDPEMALDIVDLGLVYAVHVGASDVHVRITMTSAACPVAELIMDEVVLELGRALGADMKVEVELVWEPPWEPDRMNDRARSAMGLD